MKKRKKEGQCQGRSARLLSSARHLGAVLGVRMGTFSETLLVSTVELSQQILANALGIFPCGSSTCTAIPGQHLGESRCPLL